MIPDSFFGKISSPYRDPNEEFHREYDYEQMKNLRELTTSFDSTGSKRVKLDVGSGHLAQDDISPENPDFRESGENNTSFHLDHHSLVPTLDSSDTRPLLTPSYGSADPDDDKPNETPRISTPPVGLLFPAIYYEESPEYFAADEFWMTHTSWKWMYCLSDCSYYHVDSNTFYFYDPNTQHFYEASNEGAQTEVVQTSATVEEQDYEPNEETGADVYDYNEDGEDFFFVDFEKDISVSTAEIMTDFKGKTEREDRHITKELLPLDIVSDSEACCFYTAIFDGHGGSICAEYCAKHLSTNLITTYRQVKETIAKKLRKQSATLGREATTIDIGLSYSAEIEALRRALQKAFEITNANYLNLAQRKGYADGCTALVVLVYGPDEDGSLKVLTAHCGDCRAVMCRELDAVRLTEDHKPEKKNERRRIEAAGGKVVYMKEVWRVTAAVGKKLFGLSTARSIGDLHMKIPKEFVTAIPDLRIITVDFSRDQFLVLGSDGIWDVVSDQDACDLVNRIVSRTNSSQEAADAIAKLAKDRGSSDDKTVTVVLFAWHSQVVSSPG